MTCAFRISDSRCGRSCGPPTRAEGQLVEPTECDCERTAGIDYVCCDILRCDFWGYSDFRYYMLHLESCLALGSIWQHEETRTWATNDSLIKEVTMVDLPTPSALYVRPATRRADSGLTVAYE